MNPDDTATATHAYPANTGDALPSCRGLGGMRCATSSIGTGAIDDCVSNATKMLARLISA